MLERAAVVLAACGLLVGGWAAPVRAEHRLLHEEPQGPAPVQFPDDFAPPTDEEWGFVVGGFGGLRRGAEAERPPVIFVHGNTTDHADWYPARNDFLAAGWSEQELWGLSYNGLGSDTGDSPARPNPQADEERQQAGWDGASRSTYNEVNVADLHAFIERVRDYTGHDRFSVVGHSLGVTLARRTLQAHPGLQQRLVAFVGIAGANHGTSLCPPGSEGLVVGCDEIAAGTDWLEDLNGSEGEFETYPPARWLTVSDGSGVGDVAFLGPTYAQSPQLAGADNRTYPGTDHNDLRLDEAIVAEYREFIEGAVEEVDGGEPTPSEAGEDPDRNTEHGHAENPDGDTEDPDGHAEEASDHGGADAPAPGPGVAVSRPTSGAAATLPATGAPGAPLALLLLGAAWLNLTWRPSRDGAPGVSHPAGCPPPRWPRAHAPRRVHRRSG